MIAPHIAQWALTKQRTSNNNEGVAATAVTSITPYKRPKHDDSERVLETKGGGGYVPPPQPTPMQVAEANDWTAQQQWNREQKQKADQKIIDDAAQLVKDEEWRTGKGNAYTGAQTAAKNRLATYGITSAGDEDDKYGLWNSVMGALDTANTSLTQGADYSSAFSPTVYEGAIDTTRSGQRNKYATEFGNLLPKYWAEDEFGSTSDDTILASILDTQFNDAMAGAQSLRDRGQASESVFNRMVQDINTGKATANSTLQGIGGGVLQDIIGDIGERQQTSLDAAGSWDFGGQYDPTQEVGRIKDYAAERKGTLEGDIRTAVGGQEFFDINSLFGKSKARVGTPTAPGTEGNNALLDTFENEATRNDKNVKAEEGIF